MNLNELLKSSFQKLKEELREDLNSDSLENDITSFNLLENSSNIKCIISNREKIILCGSLFVENFLKRSFPEIKLKSFYNDGQKIKKNSKIFEMTGDPKIILAVERTILNFIQHLSSISTITKKFISQMGEVKTKLLDTRKTTTGLRKFEKYATSIGGAENHRMGLYDQILVKDNHIRILGEIDKTLNKLKLKKIKNYKIECENFLEVKKAIKMGACYILLDNMSPSQIENCIKLKNEEIKFEITGGITLDNISLFAKLGADYISTSKITNSTYSVDIGLDII